MAEYSIVFRPRAKKQLVGIPEPYRTRLAAAIRDLAHNPRPTGRKKLVGASLYRIRIGDYRTIYAINDTEILVIIARVAHRKEAYR